MFNDKTSIKNKSFNKKSSFDSYNSFDKKPNKEAVDLSKYEDMSGHTESRKVRKFFYFAIPVVVLEIIAILCISIYLIILPKNFCTISTNYKNAVVYVAYPNKEKVYMGDASDISADDRIFVRMTYNDVKEIVIIK